MTEPLTTHLAELETALNALNEHADAQVSQELEQLRGLRERIETRRRFAPQTLVVALAGTTGAGKSSLFNALTGSKHATVGARRPTTTAPSAAIFGSPAQGTGELLDWLNISDRYTVTNPPYDLDSVILIDLPDIDSISQGNRDTAERFIQSVDVVMWVVDPEKYADARLHEGYLRPLAVHAPVMEIVLNQVDRISAQDAEDAAADLRARLHEAGIASEVLATSVATGSGIPELVRRLGVRAAAKEDQLRRLQLDAAALGKELSGNHPFPSDLSTRAERALEQYETRIVESVGLKRYADAAAASHHHAMLRRTSWPPLRILHKGRRTPPVAELRTTFLAEPAAHLSATFVGPGAWFSALREGAARWGTALERAISTYRPPLPPRPAPRWAQWVGASQWLGIALLIAALITLGVEVGVRYFGVTLPPALDGVPQAPGFPELPPLRWSVVIGVIGVVVTLLLGLLAAVIRRVSRSRYRHRVQRQVSQQVAKLVDETVAAPLRELLAEGEKYSTALPEITAGLRSPARANVRKVKN